MKVTHYQIVPVTYGRKSYRRRASRKRLASPTSDVVCLAVLAIILLLAPHIQM